MAVAIEIPADEEGANLESGEFTAEGAAEDAAEGQVTGQVTGESEVGQEVDQPVDQLPAGVDAVPADEQPLFPDYRTLQREFIRLRAELSTREKFENEIAECSQAVEKLAADVMRCESQVESAKGRLKAAREEYDEQVSELRGLLRDQGSGQGRLNFDSAGAVAGAASGAVAGAAPSTQSTHESNGQATAAEIVAEVSAGAVADAAANAATETPTTDYHAGDPINSLSRESMPSILSQLGITESLSDFKERGEPIGMTDREIELLVAADIGTIGKLEQRMRNGGDYWHADIGRGWGESKTDKLVNSLRLFRKLWPQPDETN